MIVRPPSRGLLRARVALATIGLLLTIPGIPVVLSLGTGGPLDPVGSQTRAVARGLDEVSAALTRVEATIHSADATLKDANATTGNAAEMTDALGSAMADMARASGVTVFGVQPFAALVPQFTTLSDRAAAVADSLRSTQTSLAASRRDLATLGTDVTALTATARRVGGGDGGDGIGGVSLVVGRILLALLLAWMAASAGLSLIEALRLLRAPRSVPEP